MGSRLYVGNLSYSTTEDKLRAAFEPYGTVASATIMLDRMSGRSRGFGFVEFAEEADAKKAIEALNGADVDGRALTVNEARAREEGARGAAGAGARGAGGGSPGGRDFEGGSRPLRGADRGGENRDLGGAAGSGDRGGDRAGRGRRGGDRDRRRHDDNDW